MSDKVEFFLELDWKSDEKGKYNVHLPSFHEWVKSVSDSSYTGTLAGYNLSLCFLSKIDEDLSQKIQDKWASLTRDGEKAKIDQEKALSAAVKAATDNLPNLNWDKMIPAERKILMGKELSLADKQSLLVKYPQG